MTARHLNLSLSVADATPVIVILPHPLTAKALQALEKALVANMGMLRRYPSNDNQAAGRAGEPGPGQDAGELEYRSWMPDAGAMEYASWTAQLLTSRR